MAEATPEAFDELPSDLPAGDVPGDEAVLLTHPVDSGDALVRILNLAQLAATSAGAIVYRMYGQDDAACPGGRSANPSTSYANFAGQCQVSGGEGKFDLAGAFAFETPNTCNAGHATPSTLTKVVLTGLALTGTGTDGTPVNLRFDLAYSRDALANGSVEKWSGDLKFDDYMHQWTPCCNEQLSVFSMLKGTHVTGTDVQFEHDKTLGNRYSGLLDIEGEGAVALSTPENLTYDSPCWRPKAGVIRFEGLRAAEIHFGYLPGPGTGTDSCSAATDTTTWTLDGVDQGPVTPDFWGLVSICIIAV